MADLAKLSQYVIDSTLLESPITTSDPSFYMIRSNIDSVVEMSCSVLGYDSTSLPDLKRMLCSFVKRKSTIV
jgi:hypothetical protein